MGNSSPPTSDTGGLPPKIPIDMSMKAGVVLGNDGLERDSKPVFRELDSESLGEKPRPGHFPPLAHCSLQRGVMIGDCLTC